MANLTHEYSNFPAKVIDLPHFKDIDDGIAEIVNQYMTLYNVGDYAGAAKILSDNNLDLSDYIVGAKVINTFIEELRNAQIVALQKQQVIHTTADEPDAPLNDIWVG